MDISNQRLEDLLIDPRESLDFEIKNWLDLQGSNEDKATFAKAILAISNHGGGFIALGLRETDEGAVEADGRPAVLTQYGQDHINGIVQNYCDPPFHCAVHIVRGPGGALFPIIVVPGGHRVPICARRSGPNGNTVVNNAIYVRKPGPRSETPQTAQEWDDLLGRCQRNRRDELLDLMRDLVAGSVPQVEQMAQPSAFDTWVDESRVRWNDLVGQLPLEAGPRLQYGRYCFAYELVGQPLEISPAQFPGLLRQSAVRHTGWPPFWYPTRSGIEPYPIDGAVECWLGGDTELPIENRDAAHSDFWRIRSEGMAFLLRGFQEDVTDDLLHGRMGYQPGTVFDVSLPIWRVGETLLHAHSLAQNLFDGPTTVKFTAKYEGLAGRTLVSLGGRRYLSEDRVARQDDITLLTHVEAQAIDTNLPEIVHPLLSPLYALFDFFDLPMRMVSDELGQMRANNF